MAYRFVNKFLALGIFWVGITTYCSAKVVLPAIFSDHMVLQQNAAVTIWGTADPGEKITVKGSWQWLLGSSTKADQDGRWQVRIPTQNAGGPHSLSVSGTDHNIVIKNILLGEVWICSGQSNMEWSLKRLDTDLTRQAIVEADYPNIRLFHVPNTIATTPQDDCNAAWQVCSPETVADFSGIGYYFGLNLHQKLHVPIGLIGTEWGGTVAQAWTSRQTIETFDEFKRQLSSLDTPAPQKKKNSPTVLYNGMIAPLIPFRIAGAIWYQGESNVNNPPLYHRLFPAMIADWRTHWGQGDFPFYYVQIAPFGYKPNAQSQALREAQLFSLSTPNTGMAVTMDIGDEKDIHPRNKQDVGDRLARWALAKTYGKKEVVFSGPLYKSMKIERDTIRLFFGHTNGGLVAKGGPLIDFEIAGADQTFVPAKAVIDGDTIVVTSQQIKEPAAVRYGWKNWCRPNLFNKAGLPASSFRTDNWPLE